MFIAIALFLLMSFFLSGSETALTAANKMKIQLKAEQGDLKSKKLIKLIEKPDTFITSILIGNNIANIMLPTLVTIIAMEYGFNVGLATGILTVVLIIFAEVLPKSIAASFSDKIAYLVAPVIRILVILLKPVTFLLSGFTNSIIKVLSKGEVQEATLSKEELKTMVDMASNEGTFQSEESERIIGMIDFYSKDVRDALKTPRIEIVGIPFEATYQEALDIVISNKYTRYPVYKKDMDNIVGVFHSKNLLDWSLDLTKTVEELMDESPLFVVQSTSIQKVFSLMQKEKKHIAIVLDEYGGTMGVISHEDIIESMIGLEIADETDDDEVIIDELSETHIICHGKLSIRRLNEVFKTKLPEEEDTLAGFLLKEIGHLPEEGETHEFHHLHFDILKVDDFTLKQIKITKKTHQHSYKKDEL